MTDDNSQSNLTSQATLWWEREQETLLSRKDETTERLDLLKQKVEAWDGLDATSRLTKATKKMKAVLRKPERLYYKLQERGDDLIAASKEGLKAYRIRRILDQYRIAAEKYQDAISEALYYSSEYPNIHEKSQVQIFEQEIPDAYSSTLEIEIVTSEGTKNLVLNQG